MYTDYLNPLIFIPIILLLALIYYLIPRNYRWILLLVASYAFYFIIGTWSILVLFFSTLANYLIGLVLDSRRSRNRLILSIGITLNVLILVFYKYIFYVLSPSSFLFSIINTSEGKVIFPVGLSFFTLQNISYLIDTSKGLFRAERNFGIYATYLAFFPKVLSGPIERGKKLIPQLIEPDLFNSENIFIGARLILFGLFKKIVIADRLSIFVNEIFNKPGTYQGVIVIVGLIFLSFQIYLDFSGYTNIALGIARIFGIELTENFKRPYLSTNIVEFWNRWHLTFSTWLRDYIFYPVRRFLIRKAGQSIGFLSLVIPPVVTMFISGLWHGTGWTFVIWGLYHALFYTIVIYKKIDLEIHIKSSNL